MKRFTLLCAFFIVAAHSFAQKNVELKNLWTDPQVHVLFLGYDLSFSVKDIDRALQLLNERGINKYGATSGLDTLKQYHLELFDGYRQEYHNALQTTMQLGVGAFLLTKGRAVIKNPGHKKLKAITIDIMPFVPGEYTTTLKCYDPKTNRLIFSGQLHKSMLNADLGIDYW